MPHIIVSYSKPALNEKKSGSLLKHLQKAAQTFETVSPEALKLRACEFDHAWSGPDAHPHVHLSFQLLGGRPEALRESMAETLHSQTIFFLKENSIENVTVTVEVRELQIYKK